MNGEVSQERWQELRGWMDDPTVLDLLSEHGGSLDTLEYRLFKNFSRCPATSPPLFLKWVERFLKNNATEQDVFGWFRSVQEETGRPPTGGASL